MENAGSYAHSAQGPKPAAAEKQLLADADTAIASVQAGCEFAISGSVALGVGIEEEQIAAADFHAPDFGFDETTASVDLHGYGRAIFSDGGLHGQLTDVGFDVIFLLPSVLVEVLAEVSLAVEETDANQRNSQVGCALDVVAGEDAQAA